MDHGVGFVEERKKSSPPAILPAQAGIEPIAPIRPEDMMR
jgi:hypothetical protein